MLLFAASMCAAPLSDAAAAQVELGVRISDDVVRLPGSIEGADASANLAQVIPWQCARPGMDWSEVELVAGKLRIPVRAIVVRIDPQQFRFELRSAQSAKRANAWTVDATDGHAVFAVNAGQFKEAGAWGWVRAAGRDRSLPGSGALAYGVAFDTAGALHWIRPDGFEAARSNRALVHAFQSYPMLLVDGRVPVPALDRERVDHDHRDARLIMAQTADGSLLFVLTRFDALGRTAERLPIGLTLPESIVLVRSLGARHAIMLDGGISAQMLLRGEHGIVRWRGLRSVPLGLIAIPNDGR